MTVSAFLQPGAFAALVVWSFTVLAAAQLTIRLIMAFSARLTLVAAVVLSVAALPVAVVYDAAIGPDASLATRLNWAPLPILLTGAVGFAIARWLLRIRRLRGQVIAGLMVGLLDPHLFTILWK